MRISHKYEIVKIRSYEKLTPFTYESGNPRYPEPKRYILQLIDKLLADAAG